MTEELKAMVTQILYDLCGARKKEILGVEWGARIDRRRGRHKTGGWEVGKTERGNK